MERSRGLKLGLNVKQEWGSVTGKQSRTKRGTMGAQFWGRGEAGRAAALHHPLLVEFNPENPTQFVPSLFKLGFIGANFKCKATLELVPGV